MSAPPLFVMPKNVLFSLGLPLAENTFYQLPHDKLIQQCVERKEVVVNPAKQANGISHDVFIVKDKMTDNTVDWAHNQPVEEQFFDKLYRKMIAHLDGENIWIRDSYVDADPADKLYIRSISEDPESDLFVYSMFLHPTPKEIENFNPDWHIIHMPTFSVDQKTDGISQDKFAIINFTKRVVLIGGLAYDNEIKEIIFSVLNQLPAER